MTNCARTRRWRCWLATTDGLRLRYGTGRVRCGVQADHSFVRLLPPPAETTGARDRQVAGEGQGTTRPAAPGDETRHFPCHGLRPEATRRRRAACGTYRGPAAMARARRRQGRRTCVGARPTRLRHRRHCTNRRQRTRAGASDSHPARRPSHWHSTPPRRICSSTVPTKPSLLVTSAPGMNICITAAPPTPNFCCRCMEITVEIGRIGAAWYERDLAITSATKPLALVLTPAEATQAAVAAADAAFVCTSRQLSQYEPD